MKLINKIGILGIAVLLGFSLVACKSKDPVEPIDDPTPIEPEDPADPVDPTPTIEAISIAEVLGKANNDEVSTKGVVFAKTSKGIYVNDGTASIYVLGGLNSNVKDEVTIDGSFTLVNMMPEIKNAEVKVVGSDKEELKPISKSLADIVALSSTDRKNYGQYYTVSGVVTKDLLGTYSLVKDDKSIFINEESNVEALASWENKDVLIDVVVTSSLADGWTVSYCKTDADVRENPLDLEAIKGEIFEFVDGKLPTKAYGSLSLPKSYSNIPNVAFTWSVKEGTGIVIDNNVATVTVPEADTEIKLELTLSNCGNTVSKEYTVTNKTIRTIEIKDLGTTNYASDENIYVEGRVILTTRSSGSVYSNIIVDREGQHFARIDSTEELSKSFNANDEIKVLGKYSIYYGGQRVKATSIERTKEATSNVIDWSSFPVKTLTTEKDFVDVHNAMDSAAGLPVNLYKVENPYVTTSATTGYNYLRFGLTPTSAKSGVTAADNKNNTASISVLSLNQAFGEDKYLEIFEIGAYNEGAIKNVGLSFYAFCLYNTDSMVTAQFAVVPEMLSRDLGRGISQELEAYNGLKVNASEDGVLELPKKIGDVNLTWTTNCPTYNIETGVFTALQQTSSYTFTAKYTVNDVELTKVVEITFEVSTIQYLTVSQFNAKDGTELYNVEGTIIAFATANGDYSNTKTILGMYISDGTQIAYVNEDGFDFDTSSKNAYQIVYTYGAEKTPYQVGDVIRVTNVNKNSTGVLLTTNSVIKVTPKDDVVTPIVFAPTNYLTVSSKADCAEQFAKGNHKLIKVVATEDNPICIGSSKTSDGKGEDISILNKIRLYFYEGVASPGVDGIRVDGAHTWATKAVTSELNMGSAWWRNLGSDTFNLTTNSTSTKVKFVGEFYVCISVTSDSFYMATIIVPGFNLTALA